MRFLSRLSLGSITDRLPFADYQAALIDDDGRSIHSVESRRTQSTAGFSLATKHQLPAGSYQGGADYYRDTTHSRNGSRTTFNQYPSAQGMPSFGYGAGPGSAHGGSEFGYGGGFVAPLAQRQSQMSFAPSQMSFAPPSAPFNRRDSHMSGLSGYGGFPQGAPSVYSMNPFTSSNPATLGVSGSSSPTDVEIVATLKSYLAHQDLVRLLSPFSVATLLTSHPFLCQMQVTKRSAREGIAALFPNADLAPRKDFINSSIDGVLQGRL